MAMFWSWLTGIAIDLSNPFHDLGHMIGLCCVAEQSHLLPTCDICCFRYGFTCDCVGFCLFSCSIPSNRVSRIQRQQTVLNIHACQISFTYSWMAVTMQGWKSSRNIGLHILKLLQNINYKLSSLRWTEDNSIWSIWLKCSEDCECLPLLCLHMTWLPPIPRPSSIFLDHVVKKYCIVLFWPYCIVLYHCIILYWMYWPLFCIAV